MLDEAVEGKPAAPYVLVRAANGAWTRRDIQTGLVSNTHVVVKSGLRRNDVVALERPRAPKDDEQQDKGVT
jgi:hypothetical protein